MSARGGLVSSAGPVAEDRRTPAQRAMDERDWEFEGAWPFTPRWHSKDGVRLHYVDEGPPASHAVVFVHGSPAWSFLFRHQIAGLRAAGRRAVAVDLLGFGRSDKPHRLSEYSLERHRGLIASLLEQLELEQVTLVMHGWGGPLALDWALARSERIRAVALLNTFLEPLPARGSGPLGRLLVKGARRTARGALSSDLAGERLDASARAAYAAPHPSWDSRTGILAFERAFSGRRRAASAEALATLRGGLASLARVPSAIVWGMGDRELGREALAALVRLLPAARVERLEGVGSLVPEYAPDVLDRVLAGLELEASR